MVVHPLMRSQVQRELAAAALHDEARALLVGEVVVASLPDRDAVEEVVRAERDLHLLGDATPALQRDTQPLAHRADAAVAAHQVAGLDDLDVPVGVADLPRTPLSSWLKSTSSQPKRTRHRRELLGDRDEQRLEVVLRHQLVRLERFGSVARRRDHLAVLVDCAVLQDCQGRLVQARDDQDVHRRVARVAERAHIFRDTRSGGRTPSYARSSGPSSGHSLVLGSFSIEQGTDAAPAEIDGEHRDPTGPPRPLGHRRRYWIVDYSLQEIRQLDSDRGAEVPFAETRPTADVCAASIVPQRHLPPPETQPSELSPR